MVSKQATIRNGAGIHVRPSGVVCSAVHDYDGSIRISGRGMDTDLNGVMGLIAMGLRQGDVVTVEVDGPSEDEICSNLVDLLERVYDFPPPS